MRGDLRARAPGCAVASAAILLLAGCAALDGMRQTTRAGGSGAGVHRDRIVDEAFEPVWKEVMEVVRSREYAAVETDRGREENTYSYEYDRDRGREETGTVTEEHATVRARTAGDGIVELELRERHGWTTTGTDLALAAIGHDETRTLEREGVEIAVPEELPGNFDLAETRAVLEEIDRRLLD